MDDIGLAVGERVRGVRGSRSQQEFADHLGVSVSSVRRYESGERLPDAEFFLAVLLREGVGADWLLTGQGLRKRADYDVAMNAATGFAERVTDYVVSGQASRIRVDVAGLEHWVSPDDYRWIPVLNVRVRGGLGEAVQAENVIGFNAYRREWLAKKGLLEAQLSEVTVSGDSMHPELRAGDTVLVNHSENELQGGSIYVLRQGEDLIVKYLQKLPGNRIQVVSENGTAFPPFEIEPEAFESGEYEIVGRVVRQGRDR